MPIDLVQQNIHRHARENDFRQAVARGLNQGQRGNERRAGIAEAGDQADERIDADAEIGARDADEIVHQERDPAEERLDWLRAFRFPAEDFPLRLPERRILTVDFQRDLAAPSVWSAPTTCA